MVLKLIEGDITKQETDVIVNAANSSLLGGGGVDGAIHRAGGKEILEACRAIRARQGGCETGEAVLTTAGRLPSRFVIHTVGPVWQGGQNREEALLKSCYVKSLQLAREAGARSVSFPNISTGIYGYPKELAAAAAVQAVRDYAEDRAAVGIEEIRFVCFAAENYRIYQEILQRL
ncbi:O-acetyl-ADP-ribose deacetylase [Paenibacillus sp. CAA11]|uniref:O-acetyl-ADP-ribose deacetylase n=1 Tax=Paenibacillus sp. CAA11 TaxID=1532905 RepID=UPI001900E993|nr:O-acetyl-ADP-ribose deacetylase [Paenibacillus sp. CAA11]